MKVLFYILFHLYLQAVDPEAETPKTTHKTNATDAVAMVTNKVSMVAECGSKVTAS